MYKAPRGPTLQAKSWQAEAALRMLLNNLDPEVAEDSEKLIVYGGRGKAARNPEALKKILELLLKLENDQSLLIQSGKAVGIVRTHIDAPRVLIANSNLVPHWANWEEFDRLQDKGLMMYGQMTAGSWIYIGTQGILQGTYETFKAVADKHFKGSLKNTLTVTGGLGGMGGAQPLSVTLNEGKILGVDIDPARIQKRIESGYIDKMTGNYHEALKWLQESEKPLSVGLVGDIGTTLSKLIEDRIKVDIVTDQTSAHDPVNGYIPSGLTLEQAKELRKNPAAYKERSLKSMAFHIAQILKLKDQGAVVFDYGNNLREFARQGGEKRAFEIEGFVPAYIRPLFCKGQGPFRWVALSGDPEDIYTTDEELMKLFPRLTKWLTAAREKVHFQGLPARICWLGMGEREQAGLLFNRLVREKKVKAPIVIGRDHLDCGSVASPYRETEGMLDGSDAVSDWPLLNLLSNCAGGASWVSFHHGGGVGMGYSQHAGMVIVADGSERADHALKRVLFNDPALGLYRHADAGYKEAKEAMKQHHLEF